MGRNRPECCRRPQNIRGLFPWCHRNPLWLTRERGRERRTLTQSSTPRGGSFPGISRRGDLEGVSPKTATWGGFPLGKTVKIQKIQLLSLGSNYIYWMRCRHQNKPALKPNAQKEPERRCRAGQGCEGNDDYFKTPILRGFQASPVCAGNSTLHTRFPLIMQVHCWTGFPMKRQVGRNLCRAWGFEGKIPVLSWQTFLGIGMNKVMRFP